MSDLPETIFKYEPFSLRAIQNLKCHSVYFGSPASFNDPFDCAITPPIKEPTEIELAAIEGKIRSYDWVPKQEKAKLSALSQNEVKSMFLSIAKSVLKDQISDFNTKRGVTCLSACNDNMLLWSHYGGQHRGFCLEFKTKHKPFHALRFVKYCASVPEIDIAQFMLSDNYEHIIELFCIKSLDWEYERELRALHEKAGTLYTYEGGALKAIYFGAKMSEQDLDLICLILHGQNAEVELFRGRKSKTQFRIELDRLERYVPYIETKSIGLA